MCQHLFLPERIHILFFYFVRKDSLYWFHASILLNFHFCFYWKTVREICPHFLGGVIHTFAGILCLCDKFSTSQSELLDIWTSGSLCRCSKWIFSELRNSSCASRFSDVLTFMSAVLPSYWKDFWSVNVILLEHVLSFYFVTTSACYCELSCQNVTAESVHLIPVYFPFFHSFFLSSEKESEIHGTFENDGKLFNTRQY